MKRIEKIQKLKSGNLATPQTDDNAIFHTKDESLAKWAIENKMHVQGMRGCKGYSAYIWIDEPANEKSFVVPS